MVWGIIIFLMYLKKNICINAIILTTQNNLFYLLHTYAITRAHSHTPVSYTHLDVYKRQTMWTTLESVQQLCERNYTHTKSIHTPSPKL